MEPHDHRAHVDQWIEYIDHMKCLGNLRQPFRRYDDWDNWF